MTQTEESHWKSTLHILLLTVSPKTYIHFCSMISHFQGTGIAHSIFLLTPMLKFQSATKCLNLDDCQEN